MTIPKLDQIATDGLNLSIRKCAEMQAEHSQHISEEVFLQGALARLTTVKERMQRGELSPTAIINVLGQIEHICDQMEQRIEEGE